MPQNWFTGKLYPTDNPDDPHGFSREEAKRTDLRGKPIWIEHSPPAVGEIKQSGVDTNGYWNILFELYPEEKIGALYKDTRDKIKRGELNELSINWGAPYNTATNKLCGPRQVREGSLCKEGRFPGTNLLTVCASKEDSTNLTGYQSLKLEMEQPQQDTQQQQNTAQEGGDMQEYISRMSSELGLDLSKFGAIDQQTQVAMLKTISEQRESTKKEIEQEKEELMRQNQLTRQKLEQFEREQEEANKKYAERETNLVEPLFKSIEKDLDKDQRENFLQALQNLAASPERAFEWHIIKTFRDKAEKLISDNKRSHTELDTVSKSYNELQKKHESALANIPSQVSEINVQGSAKGFDAKRAKTEAEQQAPEEPDTEVTYMEVLASKARTFSKHAPIFQRVPELTNSNQQQLYAQALSFVKDTQLGAETPHIPEEQWQ